MRRFLFHKLVRDLVPQDIEKSGCSLTFSNVDKDFFLEKLKEKLMEEAKEVCEAENEKEIQEELADLLEVLRSIAYFYNLNLDDIIRSAEEKKERKGDFSKGNYAFFVDIPDDHPDLSYYTSRPSQYPEEY